MRCHICPKACELNEGEIGFCKARINRGGQIVAENYGKIASMGLDPIEKKPLRRFSPGSQILSVGSYGCNFRCDFCQNYRISMVEAPVDTLIIQPEQLIQQALDLVPKGNIGVAYTYNEPLIGYEFVMDCSKLAVERGLKNVVVTNGYVNEKPFRDLLPYVHAFNIDLKGFTKEFYEKVGGDLEVVKNTISIAAEKNHVEVTTLVIPGENDKEEEIRQLSSWLASVDKSIPLHISRFFPSYRMLEKQPTPLKDMHRLVDIARESLLYVY